jgi:hypothetical protein
MLSSIIMRSVSHRAQGAAEESFTLSNRYDLAE